MSLCSECAIPFIPERYQFVCDSCGDHLSRRFESLQEFDAQVLDLSVVVSRAVFGESAQVERVWKVR